MGFKHKIFQNKLRDLKAVSYNRGMSGVRDALNSADKRYLPRLHFRTGKQVRDRWVKDAEKNLRKVGDKPGMDKRYIARAQQLLNSVYGEVKSADYIYWYDPKAHMIRTPALSLKDFQSEIEKYIRGVR